MTLVPHYRRFPHVSALSVLFEHGRIQIQSRVVGLIIQRYHLYTKRPEDYGIEVGRIDTHSSWISPNQLRFRVRYDTQWLLSTNFFRGTFVQRRALKARWYAARRPDGKRSLIKYLFAFLFFSIHLFFFLSFFQCIILETNKEPEKIIDITATARDRG